MSIPNRAAFVALLSLFIVYAWHSWYGPDVYYHLSWGRDLFQGSSLMPVPRTLFTQPLPANIYWIFQGWLFWTYSQLGLYGVSLSFAAVWTLILINWINLIGGFARPLAAPLALVFLILAQPRFEERPEVFSYALILLTITLLLKLNRSRKPAPLVGALVLVEFLWTGTHGYFALGPLLAGASLLASPLKWRGGIAAFLACLTPTLLGPFGLRVWQMVALYAKVGTQLKDLNQELFTPSVWPMSWPTTLFWLAWIATLALLLRFRLGYNKDFKLRFASLLALGGLALSANSVRNIPMLPLLAAPLWSACRPAAPRFILDIVYVAMVPVCVALGLLFIHPSRQGGDLSTFGVKKEWASYPIGAAQKLSDDRFKGLVFADSYDGGYLEFVLPNVRVAGDSYFSDPDTTRAYFTAIKDPEAFRRLISQNDFGALLLNVENLAIVDMIMGDARWQLVYADSHRALFYPANLARAFDLAEARFWHGESLANTNNAFGPMTWAAIAAHRGRRDVLLKITKDLADAPTVPHSIIDPVVRYAGKTGDRELQFGVEKLKPCDGFWDCR